MGHVLSLVTCFEHVLAVLYSYSTTPDGTEVHTRYVLYVGTYGYLCTYD